MPTTPRHLRPFVRSKRRSTALLAGAGLTAVLSFAALGSPAASARTGKPRSTAIVVATPSGKLNCTLNETIWRPFTQLTHQKIRTVSWNDAIATSHQDIRVNSQNWSLALVEDDAAQAGCAAGLFVSSPSADVEARDPNACGVPALSLDFALSWDSSRFSGRPNWRDFWDVARNPGKRGLRADPRGTLEAALLSEGVPLNAIYSTLSTPEGLDRAFRRLSQLRPYIVWWKSPEEAMYILTSGAALMGLAPTAEVLRTNATLPAPRFRILWFPLLRINYDWVIPTGGTRDLTTARALQTWASASEQQNALNGRLISAPPTSGPDALPNPGGIPPALPLNATFWREHFPAIEARFDKWRSMR
ncbi:extracellular solute-binding protein [Acetobacter conturbans]|uniref:extracellular solute-binding protein n=1 Tax=Acetobacter conturbans TaxID=1737472 RepID=UPI001F554949|nr:extracellular solute-binding protein [Acetobacter conturbans]